MATSGLLAAVKDSELCFHLINLLLEQISLQLKLQPKVNYSTTVKALPKPGSYD